MEEKERYIIGIGKGEDICIADNDRKAMFTITTKKLQDLLNQQDKHIKKLQEEIKKANINNYLADYWLVEKENQQLKQSQKQLAIEELKLALENFRNRPTYFDIARQELCLSDQDKQFIDFINNRIKELDGGKNDHN